MNSELLTALWMIPSISHESSWPQGSPFYRGGMKRVSLKKQQAPEKIKTAQLDVSSSRAPRGIRKAQISYAE